MSQIEALDWARLLLHRGAWLCLLRSADTWWIRVEVGPDRYKDLESGAAVQAFMDDYWPQRIRGK